VRCAGCGIGISPPDGKEKERMQRYVDIALPIAKKALREDRSPK